VICVTFQMAACGVNGLAKVSAELPRRIARMTGDDRATPMRLAQSRASARKPKQRRRSALPARLSNELFAGAEVVRLPAGQVLFRAGDSADGCYRVEDGLLKVTMVSNAGTERILAFHGPGAIVGELAIIDGLPRTTSAVAVCDSGLSFLSRAAFEAFAEKHHPEFCQSLFRLLAKRVRERDKVVAATSFLSLKGRIAQTLLELSDHFGQEVRPGRVVIRQKIRQRDLAAMAGTARENVTRVLNDWQRRKLVSRLSGYYCVENKALLEHQVKHQ
jgi:CRP/FNR family transcriptional regulator, cyclic AMP receptor protein